MNAPGRGGYDSATADLAITLTLLALLYYRAAGHTRPRPRVWLAWLTWQTARHLAWRAGQLGLRAETVYRDLA